MESKPAVKSITIWGGVISILASLVEIFPDVAQELLPVLSPQAAATVAATGGVIAILGRRFGGNKPIEGIVKKQ